MRNITYTNKMNVFNFIDLSAHKTCKFDKKDKDVNGSPMGRAPRPLNRDANMNGSTPTRKINVRSVDDLGDIKGSNSHGLRKKMA